MSNALYIVLEKEIPDFALGETGKAVGLAVMELDELAQAEKFMPLSDFVSLGVDDFADMIGAEHAEGLKEILGAEGLAMSEAKAKAYHSAADGLNTVQGLRTLLRTEPERYNKLKIAQLSPSVAALISDLNEYEAVLLKAQEHDIGWKLCMDF